MKSVIKISLVILLVLFIMLLVYLNINKYTNNDNVEELTQETSTTQNSVNDAKVNVVYNTIVNVTATKNISQSTTNSTSGYAPQNNSIEDNVEVVNDNVIEQTQENDEYIKDVDLVNLEITNYDFESNNIILTITDNNEIAYSWNQQFKIEKKNEEGWEELNRINPEKSLLIKEKYIRDENNQIDFKINWTNDYGTLESGIYRIVKVSEGNTFYSNEFEIN